VCQAPAVKSLQICRMRPPPPRTPAGSCPQPGVVDQLPIPVHSTEAGSSFDLGTMETSGSRLTWASKAREEFQSDGPRPRNQGSPHNLSLGLISSRRAARTRACVSSRLCKRLVPREPRCQLPSGIGLGTTFGPLRVPPVNVTRLEKTRMGEEHRSHGLCRPA
jgi:hypothetical protein